MPRHRFFSLAIVASALALNQASAGSPAISSADKTGAAGKKGTLAYRQQKDIVYGEADGTGLVMDIFTPVGAKNGLAIVDVVSGAWYSDRGKIEQHRRAQFFDIFCGRGYTVFAIRPGSRTKFSAPEMVKHLRTGIRWARERANDYGVDANNLALSGASAGGHLACLTIVSSTPANFGATAQPFKAVGVFFPPTDFVEWGGYAVDFSKNDDFGRMVRGLAIGHTDQLGVPLDKKDLKEKVRLISPARLVQEKEPPFLIIHGDADPLVPLQQSQVFIAALKKAGGAAELIIKHGGAHPWPTIHEEVKVLADWFDKELHETKVSQRSK